MLRSLRYYWRINLAVVAAAAVATAVLAGAVIVGDSMRASLRELTLDRLGRIDSALVSDGLFRAQLADDLEGALDRLGRPSIAAPALMIQASAIHTETRALAGGITLLGVDARFAAMFDGLEPTLDRLLDRSEGQLFPSVVINHSLARELGAETGDSLLVSYEAASDIPRESLLGNQPDESTVAGLRLAVTAILPDRGPGRFRLAPNQQTTYNAYVSLDTLQRRLDRQGQANALFVGARAGAAPVEPAQLAQSVGDQLRLDDLGLEFESIDNMTRLSSRRFVLREHTVTQALELFRDADIAAQPLLGYLANELRVGDLSIPYSMLLGVDRSSDPRLDWITDLDGRPLPTPGEGEIVLSQWAADELEAGTGDHVALTYYSVGANDELLTTTSELEVAGVAAMAGLTIDGAILPDSPGIADADDISAWTPPFPMDLGRIRAADEQFWDQYGAAAKGIVSLETAQGLWANRFGQVTTLRASTAAIDTEALADDLLGRLEPRIFGLAFQPVKAQGLSAATGATDFAGLFIGFSIFLIGSAALVVGMIFSLSVELRAREIGLRRAVGFPPAALRRRLLREGLLLAGLGGLVGAALAVGYAAVLIDLLAGLWKPMLDLPLLLLELRPVSLVASVFGALLLVGLMIVLGLRRLRSVPTAALLAGVTRGAASRRQGRSAGWLAIVSLSLAAAAIVAAIASGSGSSPAYFFGAGALLIVAGLSAFSTWCRRTQGTLAGSRPGWQAYLRLVARNSAHNPGRSLLSVALVACATFMLVSVAANRRELRPETLGRDSGTGGFSLVAESDAPLRGFGSDGPTMGESGLGTETSALLDGTQIFPLRFLPGEDTSCLNLYQPEKPRVVGVTEAFVERGGFSFSATAEKVDNPWTLLHQPVEDNVIPAIGDANSVRWILHSGLGQEIPLVNDHGETVRLRFVALLDKSIFQSEVVVAEEAFLRHFPQHGGYSYFLFDTPPGTRDEIGRSLEAALASYGFDATGTADKLARFLGIEEMYLSTFQLLGGLGLILGTVGLGIVLIRNVNERRTELAMMRAFGFSQRSIARMIVLENGFQLMIGLLIGTAAGFLALLPYFLDASLHLPWRSLFWTLVTVIGVAMLSSLVGVSAALRTPLLPALKAE
ncbi:MAG: ABC transporter permease [Deltaproteobacteria bacterium]|nr:ABC transporter permease [Deltaproteobacteria bacterium]